MGCISVLGKGSGSLFRSSFEIEHITPDATRTERFIALLQLAGADFSPTTGWRLGRWLAGGWADGWASGWPSLGRRRRQKSPPRPGRRRCVRAVERNKLARIPFPPRSPALERSEGPVHCVEAVEGRCVRLKTSATSAWERDVHRLHRLHRFFVLLHCTGACVRVCACAT